jgi:predicted transcriptional regulator of viral defense system
MTTRPSGEYGMSSGIALAGALATAGLYIFRTEDAQRLAPRSVSPAHVPYLLKVLTDAGWLIRLRRGLYAGTGQLPGGVDVPPLVLATALVSPSSVAFMSALAYHDLTDQVPRVISVVTPKKVVTPSMRGATQGPAKGRHTWHVAGIECRFTTIRADRYDIGLAKGWIEDRFSFSISDQERTVLDLFAMPGHFGGIAEGLSVLDRARDEVDIEKLVDYAIRYRSVAVAKRLGWSLEHSGVEMASLMRLLEVPVSSYSLLDPGRPRRGEHDRRWRVIVNIGAKSA